MTRWGPIEALDAEMNDRLASMKEALSVAHSEAKRLREERDALKAELREVRMQSLADLGQAQMAWEAQKAAEEERDKALEVNAEQANQITYWRDRAHHAEDQLRRAQQLRLARSGE